MLTDLESTLEEALSSLQKAQTSSEIEDLRIKYLGRKGTISNQMRELKNVCPQERPQIGKTANRVKSSLVEAIKQRLEELKKEGEASSFIDITLPGRRRFIGHKHPITSVIDDSVDIFRRMGFIVAEGPRY